jgi:hypothetical protein
MTAFFASGHAVDVVLAVMVIEMAVLITAQRSAMTTILASAPGMLILLGLRAALVGASWPWIASALAVSFPVHLLELRRRGLVPASAAIITRSASTSDRQ